MSMTTVIVSGKEQNIYHHNNIEIDSVLHKAVSLPQVESGRSVNLISQYSQIPTDLFFFFEKSVRNLRCYSSPHILKFLTFCRASESWEDSILYVFLNNASIAACTFCYNLLLKWSHKVRAKEYSSERSWFRSCSRNSLIIWKRKIHYYFHNSPPLISPEPS
jgi:hypothetical protein